MLAIREWLAVGEDWGGGRSSQGEKNEICQAPAMCQDPWTKVFYIHTTCDPKEQQSHPKCPGSLHQDSLVYGLNSCVEGDGAGPGEFVPILSYPSP